MYIGSYPPRNSHFHFVIRHSIAGISLMRRLAESTIDESIISSLLDEERFFFVI